MLGSQARAMSSLSGSSPNRIADGVVFSYSSGGLAKITHNRVSPSQTVTAL
jgi:hypothetical protein